MRTIRKDVDEELIEVIDWTKDERFDGTISSSAWEVGAGLTGSNEDKTATTAEIELTGGTVNTQYLVSNRVTLDTGAVLQKSFHVFVVNR